MPNHSIHLVSISEKSEKASISIALCGLMSIARSIFPFKALSITNDVVDYHGSIIPWSIYTQKNLLNMIYQPEMNPLLLVPTTQEIIQDNLRQDVLYRCYIYGSFHKRNDILLFQQHCIYEYSEPTLAYSNVCICFRRVLL